jgi:SAM-dependent methyltransferase
VGVDPTVPNEARIYDCLLSGKNNFAADREMAEQLVDMEPSVPAYVRTNRKFLGRAVTLLAGSAGIDQFLDIGAGLPTQANVHEVARRSNPEARVVYVDYDPVVAVHARALLAGSEGIGVVHADFRQPATILDDPVTQSVLDFSRPVALLMVSLLHFIADEDRPHEIVAQYRDRLVPGSYLVLTHGNRGESEDGRSRAAHIRSVYQNVSTVLCQRSHAEVSRFFDGFELLEPGLVGVDQWRPDADTIPVGTVEAGLYGAVGRLPAGP